MLDLCGITSLTALSSLMKKTQASLPAMSGIRREFLEEQIVLLMLGFY